MRIRVPALQISCMRMREEIQRKVITRKPIASGGDRDGRESAFQSAKLRILREYYN